MREQPCATHIERLFSQEFSMSLLDPKWKYIHSTATDIRQTFAKVRRELGKATLLHARSDANQLSSGASRLLAAGRYA
jgi:hypothetical protein